jgi:hypothetical protein
MRTTYDIPLSVLTEAQKLTGLKTKTQTIIMALQEIISRRKSRRILALKGTLRESFDYKELRKKR